MRNWWWCNQIGTLAFCAWLDAVLTTIYSDILIVGKRTIFFPPFRFQNKNKSETVNQPNIGNIQYLVFFSFFLGCFGSQFLEFTVKLRLDEKKVKRQTTEKKKKIIGRTWNTQWLKVSNRIENVKPFCVCGSFGVWQTDAKEMRIKK